MQRSVDHARHYLTGLLGTQRRKNMETIEGDVQDADYQGIEQFISSSPWDHSALLDQLNEDVDGLLGGHPDTGLYIDETSFIKKGDYSVGVKRQYSGRAGKIENCQVGVFMGLGCRSRACLTDFKLFLPEDWARDEKRCKKAKVPEDQRVHKTKGRLALEMVDAARARGLRYSWIGADSNYGGSAFVLNELEDAGERFLMDVRRNVKVWDQAPEFKSSATEKDSPKSVGRPAQHRQLRSDYQGRYLTVEALSAEHFENHSRTITYRHAPSGPLKAQVWVKEVWTWEPAWGQTRRRWLIVSQDRQGQFKYSLSNCMDINDWQRLCYMQHQRYFIEKAFQDAKSQLGMAQYQMRGWRGWHHHMALVCLAMLFSLKEQLLAAETQAAPLLSVRDITELLDYYLPRKARDESGLIERMRQRHDARQRDIDRKNRARSNLTKSN